MPKPTIPECPAYEICWAKNAGCEVCLELSVEEWREHAKRVSKTIALRKAGK